MIFDAEIVEPDRFGRSRKRLVAAVTVEILAGLLGMGLAAVRNADAQSAPAKAGPSPTFEVASIKLNRSDDGSSGMQWGNGRFKTSGLTTKQLIEFAYDIKEFQVSGVPNWVSSEKYDVEAKVDESLTSELQKLAPSERQQHQNQQTRLMLQALLAERFNLKVERVTKELPIYALVVAKSGPKIKPSDPPQPNADGSPTAKPRGWGGMSWGRSKVTLTGRPIKDLADVLSRVADTGNRIVFDETGLNGDYEFTLQWTPESMTPAGDADASQASASAPKADTFGPSLFTAIQEQLGLKLEARKGPVETIVITHVERPSDN